MLDFNIEKSAVYFTDNELVRKAGQKYLDRLVGCVWPNQNEESAAEKVRIALSDSFVSLSSSDEFFPDRIAPVDVWLQTKFV